MKFELTPALEASAFSAGENQDALINRISRQDLEGGKSRQVTLDNGINRTIEVDLNGQPTAVNDSDGKQRRRDFDGNWRLYVDGNRINTGYNIVDLKVSEDGKFVTMGVIGEKKGVLIETPKGTIAAKEGGEVVGTNKDVMIYQQKALDALKQFLASPESKKQSGIKV